VLPLADVPRIGEVAARLVRERGEWRERIARLRSEHVFALGKSAAVGAKHILACAGITP
jgi:hypothetical protein